MFRRILHHQYLVIAVQHLKGGGEEVGHQIDGLFYSQTCIKQTHLVQRKVSALCRCILYRGYFMRVLHSIWSLCPRKASHLHRCLLYISMSALYRFALKCFKSVKKQQTQIRWLVQNHLVVHSKLTFSFFWCQ